MIFFNQTAAFLQARDFQKQQLLPQLLTAVINHVQPDVRLSAP